MEVCALLSGLIERPVNVTMATLEDADATGENVMHTDSSLIVKYGKAVSYPDLYSFSTWITCSTYVCGNSLCADDESDPSLVPRHIWTRLM